jgi:glycosyltransferase involved in cell wall biosynthesis
MKVLYIGVYRDGTGWGNAAQNYILALDRAGVDVVPRSVNLSQTHDEVQAYVPDRIAELEENDEHGCDVCIQHILPDLMEYNGHFDMNIGMYAYETTHFRNTCWANKLNMMDQVWVFNHCMLESAHNSYVNVPTAIVPHCFDMSRYSQRYEPYPIPATEGKYVFYTIGEVTRRKNLAGLLKAFHLEFSPDEPVCLLIKGHVMGMSQSESSRHIQGMIDEIKRGLRLYPDVTDYHNEILISQWLDDTEMMRLHQTGDCFVLPSYGEAWGIPGFEAMALGKTVVLTNEGGPAEYIEDSGLLVDGRYEPVFIKPEEVPAPDIWTGGEKWCAPDIAHLQAQMRYAYENQEICEQMGDKGIDRAYEYSLDTVGQLMSDLLTGKRTPRPVSIQMRQRTLNHDLNTLLKDA